MMKKRFREAISCFTEGLNTNDKDANSYFRRGQCFLCLNDLDKAVDDFNRAIAITEGNDQYYLWRGTAYAQSGNDEPAIEDFLRAFRLNGALVINYNKQMSANSAHSLPIGPDLQNQNSVVVGNGANATKDYAEAVKRANRHLTAYFQPGTAYSGIFTQNQDTGEIKVVYPVVRAVNEPRHKGGPYFVLKNVKQDIIDRTRAVDALQENVAALFERALDYQAIGDSEHASQDFTRLVEMKPKETTYWLARAYFLHSTGNEIQSRENLAKAQELDLSLPEKIDFDPPADSSAKHSLSR